MSSAPQAEQTTLMPTGVAGLDEILEGGLQASSMYLVEGDPGTGKTTLALQFLIEGVKRGERALYGALSESRAELEATARSHGWSLDGIDWVERPMTRESLTPDAQNTMFHPSEVELGETMALLVKEAERVRPARVVLDMISEVRHLAQHPSRYRRQVLALRQFFVSLDATVLLLNNRMSDADITLQTIVRGVLSLERRSPDYGLLRRQLQVIKMRGQDVRTGYHDFVIARGGLQIFPRLAAFTHHSTVRREQVGSEVGELDALLGGGIERGSATLIIGAAGTGKTSLGTQYAGAVARRGEHAAFFVFDEDTTTMLERAQRLGMRVQEQVEAGRVTLRHIDPAELSPGEFTHAVRLAVEQDGAKLIVIDSLNGYLNAMPSEQYLLSQLHELLGYLRQHGVTTLLMLAQSGLVGSGVDTPVDASYLADAIILLRYFEADGEVRKAISVVKKRTGEHENTIRELALYAEGVRVGEPLRQFAGVLSGQPSYRGESAPLLEPADDRRG